jgi:hypothetical protein
MILFYDIIQILAWPEETGRGKQPFLLEGLESWWVRRVFVHGDHPRGERMGGLGVWSKNSCSFTVVIFQHPAEPFPAPNRPYTSMVLA